MKTAWCLGLILAFCGFSARGDEELQDWTVRSADGNKVIRAVAVDLTDKSVVLRDKDDAIHQVPWEQLDEAGRREAIGTVTRRSVVSLTTTDVLDRPLVMGSGFVISTEGLLLTNYHVLRGAAAIEVKFDQLTKAQQAECLATDPELDLAVLRVTKIPKVCRPITLAYDHVPKPGTAVLSIGYPHGMITQDWGTVNGVHRTRELSPRLRFLVRAPEDVKWIQTSAVVATGSSGAPLIDDRGRAIGISTLWAAPGMGLALQAAQFKEAVESAKDTMPLSLPLPPQANEPQMRWLSREVAPTVLAYSKAAQELQSQGAELGAENFFKRQSDLNAKFRPHYLAVAERDPTSWAGFQAYFLAASLADDGSSQGQKALADIGVQVLRHHARSERLGDYMRRFGGRADESSSQFSRRILADSPHQSLRALAAYYLAWSRIRYLEEVGALNPQQAVAARKEVDECVQRLTSEYSKCILDGASAAQRAKETETYARLLRVGLEAPELAGKSLDGKPLDLRTYRGKVVLLDFFANFCPPCRSMYPDERKLVESLKDSPFILLGVNGDDVNDLQGLIREKTITWPCIADGFNGPIAKAWRVDAVPTIYLIDPQGVVRRQFRGVPAAGELSKSIGALLDETKKAE